MLSLLWPAAVQSLAAAGVDEARFWCAQTAPLSSLGPDDQARLDELAALLGEVPRNTAEPIECPACQLAGLFVLAGTALEIHPVFYGSEPVIFTTSNQMAIAHTRGPPNGSRAPPV